MENAGEYVDKDMQRRYLVRERVRQRFHEATQRLPAGTEWRAAERDTLSMVCANRAKPAWLSPGSTTRAAREGPVTLQTLEGCWKRLGLSSWSLNSALSRGRRRVCSPGTAAGKPRASCVTRFRTIGAHMAQPHLVRSTTIRVLLAYVTIQWRIPPACRPGLRRSSECD